MRNNRNTVAIPILCTAVNKNIIRLFDILQHHGDNGELGLHVRSLVELEFGGDVEFVVTTSALVPQMNLKNAPQTFVQVLYLMIQILLKAKKSKGAKNFGRLIKR